MLLKNVLSPLKLINNDSQLLEIQDLQEAFNNLRNDSLTVGPEIYSMGSSNASSSEEGLSLLTRLSDDIRAFKQAYNNTIEPTRKKFLLSSVAIL